MDQNWVYKSFEELTAKEMYYILQLRNEVFVVEQNCIFQDADNKDQKSRHLFIIEGDQILAYCRILPPGISYEEMSIGRVVSSPKIRRKGMGRKLITKAIECCYSTYGQGKIRIGAQLYLLGFYGSFGFKKEGEIYLEDGIEHVQMVK